MVAGRGKLESSMYQLPLIPFFLAVILWLTTFLLHAIRLQSTTLSRFELKRRASAGDTEAKAVLQREELLPRVQTLRHVVETLVIVSAVALTISMSNIILGIVISALLVLFLETISRNNFVANQSQKLYEPYEDKLIRIVNGWKWLDWFTGWTTNVTNDRQIASKAELINLAEHSHGVLSRDELSRLRSSLLLDEREVRDVMTPVSVVETAQVNDTLGPLVLDGLYKTGHSRFPVIDTDIHHVVGMLYLHDLVDLKSAKKTVKSSMDPHVFYIHENQSLQRALHGFLRTRRHLFIVVNEYRETVGVLSLEDVIEELLGKKIVDEFDKFDDLRATAESNPKNYNQPKERTDI